jgi:hypothetical protein
MNAIPILMPKPTKIVQLPYNPRRAFMPFHERTQRWACLVAHRRAGKTVAAVNDIIHRALKQVGPYAYMAPFRRQAKDVAWEYCKYYSTGVRKKANESELTIDLVNGSTIQLFGADNADAMRGLGFAGAYLDEYGDFKPSVYGNVIRPALSDRQGWAVFGGTPKGHNQFYDVHRSAQTTPNWYSLVLKASESRILKKEELVAAQQQMSEDQYAQEYECSFDAAILGAFYGKEMSRVDAEGRIRLVPHNPDLPVSTAWDLGHYDDTAIWFYQNVGDEIHILDWYSESGGTIEDYRDGGFAPGSLTMAVISRYSERGYRYDRHWLPHDARAKTLGSDGKSTVEKLSKYLKFETLAIAPMLSIQDGIQAVRSALGRCFFDTRCGLHPETGEPYSRSAIEALRQYQREYNEDTHAFRTTPLHDWTSHLADAFRMLSVAERRKQATVEIKETPKFIQTDQMTLDELWAATEEKQAMEVRI